jgi:hypothetical protein
MRKYTERMQNEPLADVVEHCKKCSAMTDAVKAGRGNFDLAMLRQKCMYCKTGNGGIFKTDAIYTAIELHQKFDSRRNKGKKAIRHKTHGVAVKNLREQGKSLRDIAKTLGITVKTVQKILAMPSPIDEEKENEN